MPLSHEYLWGAPITFTQKVLLALLGIFLPPLPVFILSGPRYTVRTKEFLVTLLLTILFHPAAVAYALYFVAYLYPTALRNADAPTDQEALISSPPVDPPEVLKTPGPDTKDLDAAPPSYTESEGPSRGQASGQAPFGDHKVQH